MSEMRRPSLRGGEVAPRQARGLNALWFKWTIGCGACPATFRKRVPYLDYPSVQCPSCGVWNRLDLVVAR
jgi:hypothetical protein